MPSPKKTQPCQFCQQEVTTHHLGRAKHEKACAKNPANMQGDVGAEKPKPEMKEEKDRVLYEKALRKIKEREEAPDMFVASRMSDTGAAKAKRYVTDVYGEDAHPFYSDEKNVDHHAGNGYVLAVDDIGERVTDGISNDVLMWRPKKHFIEDKLAASKRSKELRTQKDRHQVFDKDTPEGSSFSSEKIGEVEI